MNSWTFMYSCLFCGVLMLPAVSIADVNLDSCQSDGYCAGSYIEYDCIADSGNIQIIFHNKDGVPVVNKKFNESSTIGESQNFTIGPISAWYNLTSNTTVSVRFTAHQSINGFTFECRDVENEMDIKTANCSISVKSDLAEPASFDLNDTKFCDSAHFTWDVTGNTACLKEQIIQVNDKAFTLGPSSRSYTITKAAYNNTQICLAVASRNYERTSMFSPEHCIAFDVPSAPDVKESYTLSQTAPDDDVLVKMEWMVPLSQIRPYVKWFYITANITQTDEESGSGSNDDSKKTMMNEFEKDQVRGNISERVFPGAREGYTYTFSIKAENCLGNSSTTNYTFTVKRADVAPTTTTSTMGNTATGMPSPSASPTTDDEDIGAALATFVIVIIAVIGGLLLCAIVVAVVTVICCCVCVGGVVCCAVETSSKGDHGYEMAAGTKL